MGKKGTVGDAGLVNDRCHCPWMNKRKITRYHKVLSISVTSKSGLHKISEGSCDIKRSIDKESSIEKVLRFLLLSHQLSNTVFSLWKIKSNNWILNEIHWRKTAHSNYSFSVSGQHQQSKHVMFISDYPWVGADELPTRTVVVLPHRRTPTMIMHRKFQDLVPIAIERPVIYFQVRLVFDLGGGGNCRRWCFHVLMPLSFSVIKILDFGECVRVAQVINCGVFCK